MRQDSIVLKINNVAIGGNQNLSTSFTSDPQNLFSVYAYSIQVAWTGGSAPVGTFTLQGSDDAGDSNILLKNNTVSTWTTITGSSQAVSGTPGSILYDVTQCSYRFVRLVYTATSGSAPVTSANINVKGV